jgi:aldose 1-epimerase
MIRLAAGHARAEVLPEMGAGLAALLVGGRPVLRNWSRAVADGPFALSMNLLAPFSNRISGGFKVAGTSYHLTPNLAGEPFPIHGDAFQRIWYIAEQGIDSVTLVMDNGEIGPFKYGAKVTYRLAAGSLSIQLSVTSRTERLFPFGLGFHPWFPRTEDTKLRFDATGYWPEGKHHLPSTTAPVPIPPGLNFATMAALPTDWINAGFVAWTGLAQIEQGPEAVSVAIKSNLPTAILFSPSSVAEFFCFEPVSHPVDAHNLPGMPGLIFLAQGETLTAEMTLDWT